MKHKGTRTLKTKRLTLRKFKLTDAEPMLSNWANDPEVTEYLLWDAHKNLKETKDIVLEWVEGYARRNSNIFYQWAIEFEGEPIGSISVFPSFENMEFGYAVGRKFWNQGIITEAGEAVLNYVFKSCKFHRIFSRYCGQNKASGRVMEKLGMKHEGTLRQQTTLRNGQYDDIVLYGILADEWQANH